MCFVAPSLYFHTLIVDVASEAVGALPVFGLKKKLRILVKIKFMLKSLRN